jgi:hypothetical protein
VSYFEIYDNLIFRIVFETENDGAKTKKNGIIGLLVPEVYIKLQTI